MSIELVVNSADYFQASRKLAFKELVLKDPQVEEDGLEQRIAQAHQLAMLYIGEDLAGVGALKNLPGHQSTIAGKAKFSLPADRYIGEIGYLHIDQRFRGRSLGDLLLTALLVEVGGSGAYATIQSGNVPSRRLLEKHGFTQVGRGWQSNQVQDMVHLYIRA